MTRGVRFDPRTKLCLLLECVLCAAIAPNLYFLLALTAMVGLFAVLNGKIGYALRGMIFYALMSALSIWSQNASGGTMRTMLVAFFGLFHKVYACGMMAGVVIATTKVNEFLSAMAAWHCPKKLTIPFAVMLRYLPTIREDGRAIRDAMRLRDVSPTLWGFLKAPAMTVNCIYVPLLTAASKAADELSVAAVTRGIENPKPRTCLTALRMRAADWASIAAFAAFFAAELWAKTL